MDADFGLDAHTLESLVEYIIACLASRSDADINKTLHWLQELLEFDSAIVCHARKHKGRTTIVHYVNHSYDQEWIDVYAQREYYTIDPVIQSGLKQNRVYTWDQVYHEFPSEQASEFIQAANDHHLTSGISASTLMQSNRLETNTTLCSISGIDSPRLNANAAYILHAVTPVFAEIMLTAEAPRQPPPSLTPKERSVLGWASEGKTVWEISKILSVSESTIKFHLQNMYKKLGVSNRAQAIAIASRMHLIP